MTERPDHPESALDRYLDGAMSAEQRAGFERELERDDALRAELARQRDIDSAIGRAAGVEADRIERIVSEVRERAASPQPSRAPLSLLRRGWWIATAAALLIAAGVWWLAAPAPDPDHPLRVLYAHHVANDFVPETLCETDEEFVRWVREQFEVPLAVRGGVDDARVIGWSYAETISSYSGVLLAGEGEDRVVLVMDKAFREGGRPLTPPRGDLRMFRRELGGLVIYEVSPRRSPLVLDRLFVPDAD